MSSNVISPQDAACQTSALESLAKMLDRDKYLVSLVSTPGMRPGLCVSNRHHNALTEWVYCEGDWYWWPWGDRIGITAEPDYAAAVVTNVLRIIGDQS